MGVLKFGAEGAGTLRFFIAWGYENLSGYRIKRRGAMNIFGIKKKYSPPSAGVVYDRSLRTHFIRRMC